MDRVFPKAGGGCSPLFFWVGENFQGESDFSTLGGYHFFSVISWKSWKLGKLSHHQRCLSQTRVVFSLQDLDRIIPWYQEPAQFQLCTTVVLAMRDHHHHHHHHPPPPHHHSIIASFPDTCHPLRFQPKIHLGSLQFRVSRVESLPSPKLTYPLKRKHFKRNFICTKHPSIVRGHFLGEFRSLYSKYWVGWTEFDSTANSSWRRVESIENDAGFLMDLWIQIPLEFADSLSVSKPWVKSLRTVSANSEFSTFLLLKLD